MFSNDSSFFVLYSRDITRAYSFYKKIGVRITQHEADKLVVSFGNIELHFIFSESEPFKEYGYVSDVPSYGQGAILYVESSAIRELYDMLSKIGNVKSPIQKNHWGGEEFLFQDPDGYNIAVYRMIGEVA